MADAAKRTVLKGQDAIDLWQRGRDAWNAWVVENPAAGIDFSGVDFSKYGDVSFEGFRFPKGEKYFFNAVFGKGSINFEDVEFGEGEVNFEEVTFGKGFLVFDYAIFGKGGISFSFVSFGEGDVSFDNAIFGVGDVSFNGATFGVGDIHFEKVAFGKGHVNFDGSSFGEGGVNFDNATFGDGNVSFYRATFGEGYVNFIFTEFGDGNVDFDNATFGDGDVTFDGAMFGEGEVIFTETRFGDGDISFNDATFGDGDVSFFGATFGVGNVHFRESAFGAGNIDFNYANLEKGSLIFNTVIFDKNDISFDNANVTGNLQVRQCDNVDLFHGLSFRAIRLTGTFDLEGDFTCVPDLQSTALAAHVDLQNLRIEAAPHQLKSPEDDKHAKSDPNIARLRRLKELAEQNRHHEAALHFFAMERRVARHTKAMSTGAAVLDYVYELVCDYGQSIQWPAIWLSLSVSLSAVGYHYLSTGVSFGTAAKAALVGAVPFLPLVRLTDNPLAKIIGDPATDALYFLAVGEQLFCFVFLFLFGVSLRNRFRL